MEKMPKAYQLGTGKQHPSRSFSKGKCEERCPQGCAHRTNIPRKGQKERERPIDMLPHKEATRQEKKAGPASEKSRRSLKSKRKIMRRNRPSNRGLKKGLSKIGPQFGGKIGSSYVLKVYRYPRFSPLKWPNRNQPHYKPTPVWARKSPSPDSCNSTGGR